MGIKMKELEGQVEQMNLQKSDDNSRINELESKITDAEKENEELKRQLNLITKLQESNHLRVQQKPSEFEMLDNEVDSAWSNAQLYQS